MYHHLLLVHVYKTSNLNSQRTIQKQNLTHNDRPKNAFIVIIIIIIIIVVNIIIFIIIISIIFILLVLLLVISTLLLVCLHRWSKLWRGDRRLRAS